MKMDARRARKILGKMGKDLTDEELMNEVHSVEVLAKIIIEQFLELTPKERAEFAKKKT